jgi:protein-tyrosine phosphatase
MLNRFPTSSGQLYFGRMPNLETLEELKNEHFDAIWNLGAELAPILAIEKQFIKTVIHGNIPDFGVPSDPNEFIGQLSRVIGMLRSGKKVFLHCGEGRGRTGLALACIKVMMDGSSAEKALRAAHMTCGGPETSKQCHFVHKFQQALKY